MAPGRKNYNRFEINGSRGSLAFDLERMNELEVYLESDPPARARLPPHPGDRERPSVHQGVVAARAHHRLRAHVHAHGVRPARGHGRQTSLPQPNFVDGVRNQRVLGAIEKAAATRRWGRSRSRRKLEADENRRVRGPLWRQAVRGHARLPRRARRRGGRDRHRRLSGQRALRSGGAARQRPEAEGVPRRGQSAAGSSSARSAATATRCTRSAKIARDHHDTFLRTLDLAKALDVNTVITFSGCPPGDAKAGAAQLDRLAVAARVLRDARVAVEGARRAVLEGHGQGREEGRRPRRHRDAPELRRLQPGDDDAAARHRARHDRLQLRSEPHVLAGRRRRRPRSAPSATRSITCTPRTAASTRATSPPTACSTPRNTRASSNARGSSAPAATATTRIVWKDIVSNLRLVGYDHVLSIEHEDSIMSPAEGLKKAIAFLKDIVIAEPAGEAYWA